PIAGIRCIGVKAGRHQRRRTRRPFLLEQVVTDGLLRPVGARTPRQCVQDSPATVRCDRPFASSLGRAQQPPATHRRDVQMPRRSVENAWKLFVDEYLPFVRERAGRINPDVPGPPGTEPNPIPAIAVAVVSLEPRFDQTAALGVRSLETRQPVDQHTAFPLASLSKPLASTTVALLMSERKGALAWSNAVPRLSIRRTLTYANLFSHRSGLPDHAGDLLEDLGFDRVTILNQLGTLALNSIYGYAYTNFGLTAAAERAAELAGEAWESLADRLLYRRLDMQSTSSSFEIFRHRENRTWGHRRGEDGRFFTATTQDR